MPRGGPPTPTALKIARGNPGKRPLNDMEPQPDKAMPICPDWIDDEAKTCWKDVAPKLHAMGVLTQIDGQILTNYCQVWSRWKRAEQFIQERGDTYAIKDKDGNITYIQQFPQVGIARTLVAVLNRIQIEFGMTPSARTRIHVDPAGVAQGGLMGLLLGDSNKSG